MLDGKTCTDFCTKLKSLRRVDGRLPTHDDLASQLGGFQVQQGSWPLGTWEELQQRHACKFCRLVMSVLCESLKGSHKAISAGQEIKVLLFQGEQAFRLSYPSFADARFALVAQGEHDASGPDNARALPESPVQPALVWKWLRTCLDKHRLTCGAQQRKDPVSASGGEEAVFRLIDIELRCVRKMPLETEYVTLSYVWGQLPMFKLIKGNADMLMAPGSLDKFQQSLPRTIKDAIDFVKAVDIRYLWVDALCLVQDDPEDVSHGISLMSSIYHDSVFTLVAGSGVDANAGLPGVQSYSRSPSQTIIDVAPGLQMTATHSIDWHLSRSVYNMRGWTCQELVLPRRAVIFINNTVHFRCQSANWSEETTGECGEAWLDPDDFNISRVPTPLEGPEAAWWAYQKLGEDYARRELRFDGDALRAVTGIMQPLARGMDTCLLQGLPLRYLDNALLFMSMKRGLRRRPGFASYSWAGWAGRVMWPRENFVWAAKRKMPEGRSGDKNEDDEEQQVPDLAVWMDAHTMVSWAAKVPDQKLHALFSFSRFERAISLLQGLLSKCPRTVFETESLKLKNMAFGYMYHLTGDTECNHSTLNFEERSTQNRSFLPMEDFHSLSETGILFDDMMLIGRWKDSDERTQDDETSFRWTRSRIDNRQVSARLRGHRGWKIAEMKEDIATPGKDQTSTPVLATALNTMMDGGPMNDFVSEHHREEDYRLQLMLLEQQNRKTLMNIRKDREKRIDHAEGRLEPRNPISAENTVSAAAFPDSSSQSWEAPAQIMGHAWSPYINIDAASDFRMRRDQHIEKQTETPNTFSQQSSTEAGRIPATGDTTWDFPALQMHMQEQRQSSRAFRIRRDDRLSEMSQDVGERSVSSTLPKHSRISSQESIDGTEPSQSASCELADTSMPLPNRHSRELPSSDVGSRSKFDEEKRPETSTTKEDTPVGIGIVTNFNKAVNSRFRERNQRRVGQVGTSHVSSEYSPSDELASSRRTGQCLEPESNDNGEMIETVPERNESEDEVHLLRSERQSNNRPKDVLDGDPKTEGRTRSVHPHMYVCPNYSPLAPSQLTSGSPRTNSPPYPFLYFQTISFTLILGERVEPSPTEIPLLSHRRRQPALSNDHRPGTPLLSPRTGKLAGSLHLDTFTQPGTKVECLVVARALRPTFGSALKSDTGPLLWVLHVVASEQLGPDVVERRGVGQVLEEALEEAGANVKTVTLG